MDSGEGVDFKTLRSKFQNPEALKIRTKPAIPEKPKSLTSPTTKISNPLIATINSAMENRMPLAPRVVFKDEKRSPVKRQFSQSDTVELKKDPHIHPELLDKKQKKEGDLIKQALKDKKLPLVLPVNPVTPVIQETPKPDPVPASPALASLVKISTPERKSAFNFKKTVKAEEEKTDTSGSPLPATPVFQSVGPSSSAPVSAPPGVSEPVAPKSLVPPVQAEAAPASVSPAPVIPDPVISPRVVPASKVLVRTVPEPDIVSQISPYLETLKPEIPVTNRNPQPDVYLPEEVAHSPEIPDLLDIDIPPPLIPEDILDADISALNIPPSVTPDSSIPSVASDPVSSSPDLSRSTSPAPATSASVTPKPPGTLVPVTGIPNSDAGPVSSTPPRLPSPAPDVKPLQENGMAEFFVVGQTENTPEVPSTSSKNISALSALARAEEMAPVRHNQCDQRVLNLLEKAKRKHAVSHQIPDTPEIMTSVETAPPAVAPPESSVPEKPQAEEAQAEPVLPVEASLGPETPVVPLLDIPPADYEDRAGEVATVESKPPTSKTALTNGLDQRDASPVPKVRAEQSPTKVKTAPPPPPRRMTLPPASSLSVAPEKPPRAISADLQTILPAQPVQANGIIIPAPVDFVSQNSTFRDSEVDGSSEAVAIGSPQTSVSGNPTLSVHEQAFLEQLSPEHQSSKEFVPNVETTGTDFKLEKAAGPPDSAPDSPVIPSLSGTPEINYSGSDNVYEDPAADKKSKTLKKQRKGVLMNPYADSPAANEESSRKTLFAKKTASLDDKELKKKEKQKEKEKEKEKKEQKEKEKEKREHKEKEKEHKDKDKKDHKDKEKEKEHKEKEKEKKELKDKEKEKEHKEKEKEKELKDKEKEKKEQKEKEREKKEQKEKEREKKEQKEKEREKREQKEKEKKENEMKKKFKITGEEEALYQAKVRETCKGRKDDLAVKAGETVSIIRTTDCPKGKWLARDSNNKYGYILVKSVDLDIQEMMELGKRAKTSSTPNSNGFIDPEVASRGSRSSHPYALHQESFTDDSEEWCDDDDDTVFTPTDNIDLQLNRTVSSLHVVSRKPDPALQEQIDANDNLQTRQEALQKLASFFAQPKTPDHTTLKRNTIIEEAEPEEAVSEDKQDVDLQILPPPDLYADIVVGES